MAQKHDYTRAELAGAFERVGMVEGDTVYSQSNIALFGVPEGGTGRKTIFETVLGAFQDVLGPNGTLVVPTYSYSFCKGEPFERVATPSTVGVFTEMVRRHPDAHRSRDPIFSVAAIGGRAEEITANVPEECFGADSVHDRLLQMNALVCNLNLGGGISTHIHHYEWFLKVPYRYDKVFEGVFIDGGKTTNGRAIYSCSDIGNQSTRSRHIGFNDEAVRQGVIAKEAVGRGWVDGIRTRTTFDLVEKTLRTKPWFLTLAGREGRVPDVRPVIVDTDDQSLLAAEDGLERNLADLDLLAGDAVSDNGDRIMTALARRMGGTVRWFPTGTHLGDRIVPERRYETAAVAISRFSAMSVAEAAFDEGSAASVYVVTESRGPADADGRSLGPLVLCHLAARLNAGDPAPKYPLHLVAAQPGWADAVLHRLCKDRTNAPLAAIYLDADLAAKPQSETWPVVRIGAGPDGTSIEGEVPEQLSGLLDLLQTIIEDLSNRV